jgi:hypothetical protein
MADILSVFDKKTTEFRPRESVTLATLNMALMSAKHVGISQSGLDRNRGGFHKQALAKRRQRSFHVILLIDNSAIRDTR